MPLTIEEMLQIGDLKDVEVLAGERGLPSRVVKTVVVIDVPNAGQWIRGGEFLLTSGYLFADNEFSFIDLVDSLALKNAAALGVKIGRFLSKIPDEAISKANKYNFPILKIPTYMNHVDIINPVLSAIINTQYKLLETTETIRNKFLDSILFSKGVEDILNILEDFLNIGIAFVDNILGIRYYSRNSGLKDAIENSYITEIANKYPSTQITIENRVIGYLLYEKELSYFTHYADIAIREAQRALLLNYQKTEIAHEVERRHRDVFLKDLLYSKFKRPAEVFLQAKIYGWDPAWKLIVAVIDIDNKDESDNNLTNNYRNENEFSLSQKFDAYFPGTVLTRIDPHYVALIPVKEEKSYTFLRNKIKELHQIISKAIKNGLVITLSSVKKDLLEAPHAFTECLETFDILRRTENKQGVYSWCDLGVEKVLCTLKGTEMSQNFWRHILGKLIDRQDESSSSLIQTLEALIANDWQMRPTAEFLHVHYNTLKYRIKKLEEILGIDGLQEGKQRFEVTLAFMLYTLEHNNLLQITSQIRG
jgi:purine catabolism regulator